MANTDWVSLPPRIWANPEEGWRYDRGCINLSGHLGSRQALRHTDKVGTLKELISFPHKVSSPSELKWSPRPDLTQQSLLYESLFKACKPWFFHTARECDYYFSFFCPGCPSPSPHIAATVLPMTKPEAETHIGKSHRAGKRAEPELGFRFRPPHYGLKFTSPIRAP